MAQKAKVKFNPEYDEKSVHFGFSLGINSMDFGFSRESYYVSPDTLLFADVSSLQPGFQVNIVSDYRLGEYFNLRFLPGIAFGQRNISYYKIKSTDLRSNVNTKSVYDVKLESSFLDFPFLLKYKAARINNYRPYFIGGFNVRYDLAARRKYDEQSLEYVRLKPLDFYYELGFGIDYYLAFFKFSTELKLSVGLNDVLVHKPFQGEEQYVNSIRRLTSQVVLLSFHFE
jgi:hypothetical protein